MVKNKNIELVIKVDEKDNELGWVDKLEAHKKGILHRAVSVFIFNSKGEWLLQQRAFHKYHSGGLWSNTCCTHPFPNEKTQMAVKRRLAEEMGLKCHITKICSFIYKAELDNGLTEHEFDYVYFGITDTPPRINKNEANDFKYISTEELKKQVEQNPENFTTWFKLIYKQVHELLYEYQPSD